MSTSWTHSSLELSDLELVEGPRGLYSRVTTHNMWEHVSNYSMVHQVIRGHEPLTLVMMMEVQQVYDSGIHMHT
jgi:hypothetical protein